MIDETSKPKVTGRALQNRMGRSGIALPSGCAILFGLPFLATGVIAFALIGAYGTAEGVPLPVSLAFGAVFTAAGTYVIASGVLGTVRKRRQRELALTQPEAPWLADHPWDITEAVDRPLGRVVKPVLLSAFLFVFLIPFNYLVFVSEEWADELLALIFVYVFDAIWVTTVGYALYCLVRYLKFGASSLRFSSFPFFLGERLQVQFAFPEGLHDFRTLKATLRCVEERFESPDGQSNEVRCYETWADTVCLEGGSLDAGDPVIALAFDIPTDARSTALAERPPVYWEIEIKADLPGIDYKATFLVPVYARPENRENAS